MDFTFLRSTGEVAFVRNDAEQAEWTQEEMTVLCTFPTIAGKYIERGMILLFRDPATNDWQAFEIRNSRFVEGDHYQQITGESIAIAELSDCHIRDDIELNGVTPETALKKAISGTGWAVGTVEVTATSSGDLYRGSVWQAIGTIKTNWNCYIEPRVTVNANGISKRYLDIISPAGVFRGVRLAINKNVTDAVVAYDDSELYTALYGYGANYSTNDAKNTQATTTFDDVVWSKTSAHPAKPKGQGYIEDPDKTALYGRNGKPRFGYYQNTDIDSPSTLLAKTWESLKGCYEPKIGISGTVTDLYRLGYADQPLRLHDLAIVEIEPIGAQVYRQIIRLTVDLLDATQTRPEIGDYTPNIIYINRRTENYATGGGTASRSGGRGGGGGGSRKDKQQSEFKTSIAQDERNISLNAQHIATNGDILQQAGMFIDPITGVLIYAEDKKTNIGAKLKVQNDKIETEVKDRKAADTTMSSRITQTANKIETEVKERKQGQASLSSRITQTADAITAEVKRASKAEGEMSSRITQTADAITTEVTRATREEGTLSSRITQQANKIALVVDSNNNIKAAQIVLAINAAGSTAKISADHITLDGHTTAAAIDAQTITPASVNCTGSIYAESEINGYAGTFTELSGYTLQVGNNSASWKSKTFTTYNLSSESHSFVYKSGGNEYTQLGKLVTSTGTTTIYYLGR